MNTDPEEKTATVIGYVTPKEFGGTCGIIGAKILSVCRRAMLAIVLLFSGVSITHAAKAGVTVLVAGDALEIPGGLRPKPGKPVYYLLKKTEISFGEVLAGTKFPDPALVERLVESELKKQGFLRTDQAGPMPSILITASWGAINFAPSTDAEIDLNLPKVPAGQRATAAGLQTTNAEERLRQAGTTTYLQSDRARDRSAAAAIVGADKISTTDGKNKKVLDAANEDRFYLSLTALDAEAFAKKEKQVLWRTSMSIDGHSDFRQALATMLASGGPRFATNLTDPVFIDDRERLSPEVKVGESTVVGETSGDKLPAPKKK